MTTVRLKSKRFDVHAGKWLRFSPICLACSFLLTGLCPGEAAVQMAFRRQAGGAFLLLPILGSAVWLTGAMPNLKKDKQHAIT